MIRLEDRQLPLRLLLATFAGFVNRDQSRLIAYLFEENRVFRELQGKKRPSLTDDQRRRLAAKGKQLGRRLPDKVAGIVTPDTILRWHRKLVAAHHTYPAKKRVGRPGLMKAIRELIVRMATDNSDWGYLRISGELKKVGHTVARTTIAKTLKDNGIAPSPDRPTSWSTFLKSHADIIAAADFFTVERTGETSSGSDHPNPATPPSHPARNCPHQDATHSTLTGATAGEVVATHRRHCRRIRFGGHTANSRTSLRISSCQNAVACFTRTSSNRCSVCNWESARRPGRDPLRRKHS